MLHGNVSTNVWDTGSVDDARLLKPINQSQDRHENDTEFYRSQLARQIAAAEGHAGPLRTAASGGGDHASPAHALVSEGLLREFDTAHFERSYGDTPIGGRNEHDVYLDCETNRVIKLTHENQFGMRSGLAGYLRRTQEVNALFCDDIRIEGVFRNPDSGGYRLVTSQPFIQGHHPSAEEMRTIVREFFRILGFKAYSDGSWWHAGKEVLVSDAEAHNILIGDDGKVYPIDVIPEHPSQTRIDMIENTVAAREVAERF